MNDRLLNYQEQWDQAEDILIELCEKYNMKNHLSLDEFYAEYFHHITNEEQIRVEKILNLY